MHPLLDAARRQLAEGQAGEPWYGPSRAMILADLTADEAALAPPGGAPSAWGIALHLTGWTREVARRLRGAPDGVPPEGDWPALPLRRDAAAWREAQEALAAAHADLLAAIADVPPEGWARTVPRADGSPASTTAADTLIGLAQHDAYHAGQLALTRRLIRAVQEADPEAG